MAVTTIRSRRLDWGKFLVFGNLVEYVHLFGASLNSVKLKRGIQCLEINILRELIVKGVRETRSS